MTESQVVAAYLRERIVESFNALVMDQGHSFNRVLTTVEGMSDEEYNSIGVPDAHPA